MAGKKKTTPHLLQGRGSISQKPIGATFQYKEQGKQFGSKEMFLPKNRSASRQSKQSGVEISNESDLEETKGEDMTNNSFFPQQVRNRHP
jgi:hypothetical protein